jgi:ATP-dependent DNA helicase DinG
VIDFLSKLYSVIRGKTLTLLTSFSMIKDIYTWVNINLKKQKINLYAQWIWWWKAKLLNSYLEDTKNSIILWTDSFWEWVDIPWEDLKYLIIHKFPFPVPSDPIFQARSSFFKDPFLEYSVPKAILKLKQWFWRLIRTKKDNWVVLLLDDRIISSLWWKQFFDAFPTNINIKQAESDKFLDILKIKNNS